LFFPWYLLKGVVISVKYLLNICQSSINNKKKHKIC